MPIFDRRCPTCDWSREDVFSHRADSVELCPNGHETEKLFTARVGVVGDEFIGGLTLENIGHKPMTFRSRTELKRYMAEHNLQPAVRHVGLRGSDKSPHTSRWT